MALKLNKEDQYKGMDYLAQGIKLLTKYHTKVDGMALDANDAITLQLNEVSEKDRKDFLKCFLVVLATENLNEVEIVETTNLIRTYRGIKC